LAPSNEAGHQARQLIGILRESVEPLIKAGRVVSALTAGQDSRVILAALRSRKAVVSFYTIAMAQSGLDVSTSCQLAARFGLQHAVYPVVEATPSEISHWRYMASHCVGGANAYAHPADRALNGFDFVLGGQGGELARGFLWRATDGSIPRLDGGQLTGRLGLSQLPSVVDRITAWLAGVERFSIYTQLDLAYLELRLSPWAFASAYAQNPAVRYVCPFISRRAIELMLGMPPEARRAPQIMREAIGASWPELMDIPINRYGDYRDLTTKLNAFADIPRVIQKLRKIMH
jgi:hypothetical protein